MLALHEVFDFFMYQAVSYISTWWFAALAWGLSFITGIFMGHWAIEKHDRHDHGDTHETWEDEKKDWNRKTYGVATQPFQEIKFDGCKE